MGKKIFVHGRRNYAIILFMAVFLAKGVFATTHVVQFGGTFGMTYSPSSFSAAVGDTVKWTGDFSVHPLSSTTIPAGAASWHQGSGTSFSYAIKVAGTYDYRCDVHVSIGMVGSFTVATTSVKQPAVNGTPEIMVSTIEKNGNLFIKLDVARSQQVSARVFDFSGRMVFQLADGTVSAGSHSIPLTDKTMSRGFYFIELKNAGTRQVVSFYKTR